MCICLIPEIFCIHFPTDDEGEDVALESDEEPPKEEREDKNDIFEDSKPVVAPEPVITPPIKEETPKLPVTQSSAAVEPKVTSRKSTDVSTSWNGKGVNILSSLKPSLSPTTV